jgi:hypothetical protein
LKYLEFCLDNKNLIERALRFSEQVEEIVKQDDAGAYDSADAELQAIMAAFQE